MKNNIALLRERKGIKQAELARRMNIHRSYLCRIESGKIKPSVEWSLKIAEVLGCGLDEIFLDNSLSYTSTKQGERNA